VAAEYRMKPDELMEVPGLIEQEDDWWDAGLCYIPNENLTVTAGYVNFGQVLNDEVHGGWIVGVKWEF